MVSSFTPNKSFEKPANGDDANTWDVPVNADWDAVDVALGGVASINVTLVPTGTYVLTLAQYKPLTIKFTGTLTANLQYNIPSGVGGQWIIVNACTGNFTLTIGSGGGGRSVGLNETASAHVYSDGTNVDIANSLALGPAINNQTGTSYTFQQSDNNKLVTFNNASPQAVALPQAIGQFGVRWVTFVQNLGAGVVTITPSSCTINGASILTLTAGQGGMIISDGANYWAEGTAVAGATGFLAISNNLSDLNNIVTSRTNLGLILGSTAEFLSNTINRVLTTGQVWAAAAPVNLGSISGAVTFDLNTFVNAYCQLNGSVTLNIQNGKPGQSGTIDFSQNSSGGNGLGYTAGKFASTGSTFFQPAAAATSVTRAFYYIDQNGKMWIGGSATALSFN